MSASKNLDSYGDRLAEYTNQLDRKLEIKFVSDECYSCEVYVFFIGQNDKKELVLCENFQAWDQKMLGKISSYLKKKKFCGNANKMLEMPLFHDDKWSSMVFFGAGNLHCVDRKTLISFSYNLLHSKYKSFQAYLPKDIKTIDSLAVSDVSHQVLIGNYLAEALEYANYKFTYNQTKGLKSISSINPNDCRCAIYCECINSDAALSAPSDNSATLLCSNTAKVIQVVLETDILAKQAEDLFNNDTYNLNLGYKICMDLGNSSPNHLYPETFANYIENIFSKIDGVEVKVLDVAEMQELGMGSLLGVGQGSIKHSKTVIIKYTGNQSASSDVHTVFIGKGVCFDTGGISIKPSFNMDKMKFDMCGAAATVGSLYALAKRGDKVNVVGIVGLVENMPGGNAQRPGDIVTSMSGKTVEVLNTDAEGRLVLIDLIQYAQTNFINTKNIITIATLTGAIGVALGNVHAGIFSNSKTLAEQLISSGNKALEHLWLMPCNLHHLKQMASSAADIANIATSNQGFTGSSTAAAFLQYFVNPKINFAHLDIATCSTGTHRDRKQSGANGFGVGIFNEFVKTIN